MGRRGRPAGSKSRDRSLLALAWSLKQIGYTERRIQGELKLRVALQDAVPVPHPKTGQPTIEPAVDAFLDALDHGKRLGDTGSREKPYYRMAARYVRHAEVHGFGADEKDLAEQRRWLTIARKQREMRLRLGRDLTPAELRRTLRNSVVKSSAKPGKSRGTSGNRSRGISAARD